MSKSRPPMHSAGTAEQSIAQPSNSRKRRMGPMGLMGRILLWLPLSLAVLAIVLPTMVVRTSLKQLAIGYATRDLMGSVEVGSIQASWLSPIHLQEVIITGSNGEVVVSIAGIKTTKSLLSVLTNREWGAVEIQQPTVDVTLRDNGSNLEDLLASYLTSSKSESTTSFPRLQISLVDGLVRVRSESLPQTGVIEQLNGTIVFLGEHPIEADLSFRSQVDQQSGEATLSLVCDPGQRTFSGESIQFQIETKQLPLSAWAPILIRAMGPMNCAGTLDSRLRLNWQPQAEGIDVEVTHFNAQQVALVAPNWIGQDQFTSRQFSLSGQMQIAAERIAAKEFRAQSEFAQVQIDGELDWDQLHQFSLGQSIPQASFKLDSVVDLAQVTTMLPETTRMKQGVQMVSGRLQLTTSIRPENTGPRMVVNAETANVHFEMGDKKIAWQQPLRLVAVAGTAAGEWSLHEIRFQSDVVNLDGQATMRQGRLSIEGDLRRMIDQWEQVFDLGGLQLEGRMDGRLEWNVAESDGGAADADGLPIQIHGQFLVDRPRFQLPGQPPWNDKEVFVTVEGVAQFDRAMNLAVNSGKFDLRLGTDQVTGSLQEPLNRRWDSSKIQLSCRLTGSIANWLAHAKNFIEMPAFSAAGDITSEFILSLGSQALRLNQLLFEAQNFAFSGLGIEAHEPHLAGRGNLKYLWADETLLFSKSRLTSGSFAVTTEQLTLAVSDKILADGLLTFRTEAGKFSSWLGWSRPGDWIRWEGNAVGQVAFQSKPGTLGGDLSLKINDLILVQRATANGHSAAAQPVAHRQLHAEFWREPEVGLISNVQLSDDFNQLSLANLTLHTKTADFKAEGTLSDLSHRVSTDLRGSWYLKWDPINQIIGQLAGDTVLFQGSSWQPWTIRGPLFEDTASTAWVPPQLIALFSVAWKNAQLMGVPLHGSQIDINMNQSLARMTAAGDNHLVDEQFRMQPILDLRPAEPILHLPPGTLLDRWQINENDSRTWLKYVAPLIADATSAQGEVSVSVQGAQIPVFDPKRVTANGVIDIHELTVGPGPLAHQLLPLIDQIRSMVKPGTSEGVHRSAWIQLQPHQIPYALQQGRVYHEGFELRYKDMIVRTRGSVGFDQSLHLIAEVPILAGWVGDDKMLQSLIGKSISIPISGTLSQPRLDPRTATQMVQQLVREAAVNVVQDKLTDEVNELQQKLGDKVQNEVGRLQGKVQGKLQDELESKLQNELRGGINRLLRGDKQ